ncbi:hypothetical protein C8R45DRAFT_1029553 [Mycena sanguinolenta]|nr:hypothetical protein C8R45DRAFT_1029553 [Mycena sanguinolenta]
MEPKESVVVVADVGDLGLALLATATLLVTKCPRVLSSSTSALHLGFHDVFVVFILQHAVLGASLRNISVSLLLSHVGVNRGKSEGGQGRWVWNGASIKRRNVDDLDIGLRNRPQEFLQCSRVGTIDHC